MLLGLTYQYSQLWILEMHTPLIPQCTLCTHNTKYESLRISTETLWFYSLDTSFIDLGIKFPISYLYIQFLGSDVYQAFLQRSIGSLLYDMLKIIYII